MVSNKFIVGGTVPPDSNFYIPRQADEELLNLCREGIFVYILAPRQTGKSSLLLSTCRRLAEEGQKAITIDLNTIGVNVTAEQWYLSLLTVISDKLNLATDALDWWQENSQLSYVQRVVRFFEKVVIVEVTSPVVIFIDEIDATLNLSFTDDFFAAIRALHDARVQNPQLKHLSFGLIGVATPSDLIRDPKRTPFNIGQRIDMTDFTLEEAKPLAAGFNMPPTEAQAVLKKVLSWTGGHPYLTQRLCQAVAREQKPVDLLVQETFFQNKNQQDNNIQFVRDMLTKRAPDLFGVLTTYRDIWKKRQVRDEEQSLLKTHLKLSGVVRRNGADLTVRNQLYHTVFNDSWLREHLPTNWGKRIQQAALPITAISLIAIVMTGLAIFAFTQQTLANNRALEAQNAQVTAEARRVEAVNAQVTAAARLQEVDQQRKIAQVVQLVLQSRAQRPDLGLLLSLEAVRISDSPETRGNLLYNLTNNLHLNYFLHSHQEPVNSVAVSPDGKYFVTASSDKSLILWDAATHQPIGEPMRAHKGAVNRAIFSPDGKLIASAGQDKTVILWDVATKKVLATITAAEKELWTLAFSPDGKILAFGGDEAKVFLWDINTRQLIGQPLVAAQNYISQLVFTPDGKNLVTIGSDKTISFWDAKTLAPVKTVASGHNDTIFTIAFSPDGKYMATGSGSRDNKVYIWDAATLQPIGAPLNDHTRGVYTLAFSPDSQLLASGSSDGSIIVRNVLTRQPISLPLQGHKGKVNSVSFSPDGKTLFSAGLDNAVISWDITASQFISQPLTGHKGAVYAVVLSSDGKILASAGEDKTIILWDTTTRRQIGLPLTGHQSPIYGLSFSPDGKTLASADGDKTVILWDVATGKALGEPIKGGSYRAVFSPDGKILASLEEEGSTVLIDVATRQPLTRLRPNAKTEVNSVIFSPNGKLLATVYDNENVMLWDAHTWQPLVTIPTNHRDVILNLAFSPDGKFLATASPDNYVILWDITASPPKGRRLAGHSDGVYGLAFSPDGTILASGSNDRSIILWDVKNGQAFGQLQPHNAGISSIVFSPDSKTIYAGNIDSNIIIWDFDLRNWQSRACAIANRNLREDEWSQYLSGEPYRKTCSQFP